MTVNHDVVGSSPTGGASIAPIWVFFYFEKESGTEIGNSLEFDFVVPPPHS